MMNIFVLDEVPRLAAQMHLDRHVVKMPIEYAQLLSTAHRLLDGRETLVAGRNVKSKKFWLLPSEKVVEQEAVFDTGGQVSPAKLAIEKPFCYGVTHRNHPSAVWARASKQNYNWLFELFQETSDEYTFRYGRIHKTWNDLGTFLKTSPKNIPDTIMTPFPQAMGDEFKVQNDAVTAYRNYYNGAKASFATWKKREEPSWFSGKS